MQRVFISFDFDNDADLKNALVGQARYPNSPFEIADWSVKEPFTGNWKTKVRERIKRTSVTVVICGHRTKTAQGVAAELQISRDLGKPYFLLAGRKDNRYTKPTTALRSDRVYDWTWRNLEAFFAVRRQSIYLEREKYLP